MRKYRLGDADLDRRLEELIRDAVDAHGDHEHDEDIIAEMLVSGLKLLRDDTDRGDLKLVNAALKELRYFTHIRLDGEVMPVPTVTDFTATAKDGRVSYSFVVPFETPVDPRKTNVDFGVYDETFYVSVVHDPIDPVRLSGDGSRACHFKIGEDKLHPIYFGMVFPKKVDLICATS